MSVVVHSIVGPPLAVTSRRCVMRFVRAYIGFIPTALRVVFTSWTSLPHPGIPANGLAVRLINLLLGLGVASLIGGIWLMRGDVTNQPTDDRQALWSPSCSCGGPSPQGLAPGQRHLHRLLLTARGETSSATRAGVPLRPARIAANLDFDAGGTGNPLNISLISKQADRAQHDLAKSATTPTGSE